MSPEDSQAPANEPAETSTSIDSDATSDVPAAPDEPATDEAGEAMEGEAMDDGSTDTAPEAGGEVQTFQVSGVNYSFDPEEIRVSEGDTVTIELTSDEGFHDWVVDEFDAATERVNAGETTSVTFVADQAGTYEYYCSVGNHRELGMVGTLIVE